MKRRDLETRLETVPVHPDPDPDREQYRTPAHVAADLLWHALDDGAIRDREVLDLGCGTGMFALGAVLLGARSAVGVDIDPASVTVAREMAAAWAVADRVRFEVADLKDWHPDAPFDTVVMNPPFGAQKANRGGDRVFYDRAKEAVADRDGTVWFLAQPRTERFLVAYGRDLGGELEKVAEWDYPLEGRFSFHERAVRSLRVGGYRLGFSGSIPDISGS